MWSLLNDLNIFLICFPLLKDPMEWKVSFNRKIAYVFQNYVKEINRIVMLHCDIDYDSFLCHRKQEK